MGREEEEEEDEGDDGGGRHHLGQQHPRRHPHPQLGHPPTRVEDDGLGHDQEG